MNTVVVVGLGSIGRRHCHNLQRLGVKRCLALRRRHDSNPAIETPDGAHVVHSCQEAIEQGVRAAIICTPTSRHVSDALEFLAQGIPVLVEKPIGHDLEAARELVLGAAASGVPTAMAYCMRHHPAYRLARVQLQEGAIGRVLYAKAWFESYLPDWHPWEDYRLGYAAKRALGGGVLPTLDHEIDFLTWCLGPALAAEGTCRATGALDADIDDLALLRLEFSGRVPAEISLSLCRRDRSRGFEFVGTSGTLRFESGSRHLRRDGAGRDGAESEGSLVWDGSGFDPNAMYLETLEEFLRFASGHGVDHPPATLADGLHALAIAHVCGKTKAAPPLPGLYPPGTGH